MPEVAGIDLNHLTQAVQGMPRLIPISRRDLVGVLLHRVFAVADISLPLVSLVHLSLS